MGSKFGLGVDTSIDHDTSKSADAIKKAIASKGSHEGSRAMVGDWAVDVDKLKTDPNYPGKSSSSVPELAAPETQMGNLGAKFDARDTRQNNDMQNTKNSMDSSAQKNVSRGAYIPSKHGLASSITRSETSGNVNTPGGGTGFIPKGKGSSVTSYEIPMENQTSSKIDFDSTTDAGIEDGIDAMCMADAFIQDHD